MKKNEEVKCCWFKGVDFEDGNRWFGEEVLLYTRFSEEDHKVIWLWLELCVKLYVGKDGKK